MAERPGKPVPIYADQLGGGPRPAGTVLINVTDPGRWTTLPGPALMTFPASGQTVANGVTFTPPQVEQAGEESRALGYDWFERVHIFPKSSAFGNILSQQDVAMEVYNAYRKADRILSGIAIPVSGLEFVSAPSLPVTIKEQDGLQLTLRALLDGPPAFDDFIEFTTDVRTISFAVSGTRVVIFPFPPEVPIRETLSFLTNIIDSLNGEEQRIALRKNPRQEFEFSIFREDGADRARLENLLFEWQARSFGIPVWHEFTRLTSDIAINDTVINVQSTAYADYRVGGIAIILKNDAVLDALEVSAITSTTLTFSTPVSNAYDFDDPDVIVCPVRIAVMRSKQGGEKYQVNATSFQFQFLVINNEADIADASAFNTFNSKVILDGSNAINGTHAQILEKNIEVIDGLTGKRDQFSSWSRGKRGSMKGFVTNSRQSLWEMRQLLHELRGRQVSFYLPTFQKDLVPVATLANATASLDVTHINYNVFVQQRNPNARIRVHLTNGTTIDRTVTGSSVVSTTVERLTVNSNWSTDITVAEINRIEYIQLVRFDTDKFEIDHANANGSASLTVPVKTVFDE